MGKLPNTLKSSQHLTPKQKKFAEVMVAKWGQITKAEAVREAGYEPKRDNGASELGSKLTNPNKNPHVVRYIEKLRAAETFKWEKDKLRSYKQFDRMREGNRPLLQDAIKIYTGSVVRVSGISDNEPPTLVLGPDKFEWSLLDQLLFPASR
jgi:hypothetical protein